MLQKYVSGLMLPYLCHTWVRWTGPSFIWIYPDQSWVSTQYTCPTYDTGTESVPLTSNMSLSLPRSSFVTERNPRLFYVSTFTSTSMGTTLCFIPNAACPNFGTPCPTCSPTGRKRRRALPDDQPEENYVTEEEDSLHRYVGDNLMMK